MKKLLFILFLFPVLLQAQTIWYVSESGNNANPGTYSLPKRNFYNMITDPGVSAGDKVLSLGGIFYESQQIPVPIGVSVQGDPEGNTYIESSLATAGQPLFLLQTSNGWLGTYGNQSISRLTIDGNNTTYSAISVNFRSNVKIEHCTILDFKQDGVIFYGMPNGNWTATSIFESWRKMPSYWCTGNKLLNCTITNNAGPPDGANVSIGQQNGIEIAYNTIYQPLRGAGTNCGGVKFKDDGWNKNIDLHHNNITVVPNPSNDFNFSLEIWYILGGDKYHYNNLQGAADFDVAYKGASTYSMWFHHNTCGFSTTQTRDARGIVVEASCSDVIIEKNRFNFLNLPIMFSMIWPIGDHVNQNALTNIWITNNLLLNCGITTGGTTYGSIQGINFSNDPTYSTSKTVTNVFIWNNTIVSSGITRAQIYDCFGIGLPPGAITTNFQIKNNIIKGFNGGYSRNAPVSGWGTTTNVDLNITYNLFNGNGNNNDPLFTTGRHGEGLYVTSPTYVYSDTQKADPLFKGGVPYSYELQTLSPAIRKGIYVGLLTDYAGLDWLNPPSIGAYEYTSGGSVPTVTTNTITDITSTTATSGGNVTADGGAAVTARGVCWSTSQNPTTADSKTTNGTGTGAFTSYIISLTNGLTYYVRAYATNTNGTAYGNQRSFVASSTPAADVLVKSGDQFVKVGIVLINIE